MRQRVVYFVMIWVAVTSVSAQEAKKWTLDDCCLLYTSDAADE